MMFLLFYLLGGMVSAKFFNLILAQGVLLGMSMILIMKMVGSGGESVVSGVGLGGDLLSFLMMLLSVWVILMVNSLKGSGEMKFKVLIGGILVSLICCFSSINLFSFYIFFELVLIPSFLLIVIYGYQPERVESGMYMFFYTVFGSLPLIVGIVLLGGGGGSWSLNYSVMYKSVEFEGVGILLLAAFLIKLPMYLFHIWLPKAHTEAPVAGSMVLAGVLLKLGGYGLLRIFPFLNMSIYLKGGLMVVGVYGGILSGLICMRQLDMKKLVAYSSVVHMGLMLAGVLSFTGEGMMGGVSMSVGHGFCSSGLFYVVNVLYERSSSRSMLISKGVAGLIPGSLLWSFLLVVANGAAPPFMNIFSEIFLMSGLIKILSVMLLLLLLLSFFSVAYSIYFYSVLSHGLKMILVVKSVDVKEFMTMMLHLMPSILVVLKMEVFSV